MKRARPGEPGETSAAQRNRRVAAIGVRRRDVRVRPCRDSSRVDRAYRSHRINGVTPEWCHLDSHPLSRALKPKFEGADVFRFQVRIAAGEVERIRIVCRGVEKIAFIRRLIRVE